jgi:hypothetical protein
MSWAEGVVESCTPVGDRAGDQVGTRRVLNGAFHETLQAISEVDRTLKYSIDDGPSPVSKEEVDDYVGEVVVRPVTEGDAEGEMAFVEWKSQWEASTDEAEEFCHTIYTGLLKALERHYAT